MLSELNSIQRDTSSSEKKNFDDITISQLTRDNSRFLHLNGMRNIYLHINTNDSNILVFFSGNKVNFKSKSDFFSSR